VWPLIAGDVMIANVSAHAPVRPAVESGRSDIPRASRKPADRSVDNVSSGLVKGAPLFDLRRCALTLAVLTFVVVLLPAVLDAHNVSKRDAAFVESNQGAAVGAFVYLGAKHMVTGYDHLLFLVGVIFFLYRLKDVVQYVSLFTIGHSTTLLLGVLYGLHANPYVVDAIIGFSVVYKAFDNMEGFKRVFGFQPNTKLAVLVFGLCHGFGLASKLQEFALSPDGLVANIVSFNVGVEVGQGLALTAVFLVLTLWRTRPGFLQHAFATNTLLMVGGFLLVGYQLTGYVVAQ
jgi:hypothetical protein